jgi:hypothetical protein
LKVTYTEEAVADIVEAIAYLNERHPTAAAKLDVEIARCIERLVGREFEGRSHGSAWALSCEVGACRRSGSITSAIPTNSSSCASISGSQTIRTIDSAVTTSKARKADELADSGPLRLQRASRVPMTSLAHGALPFQSLTDRTSPTEK